MVKYLLRHQPIQTKILEWLCAIEMTSWGMWLLLPLNTFSTSDVYIVLSNHMSELQWGLLTFSLGLIRCIALYINGWWRRTPIIRIITSVISAAIWANIAATFWVLSGGSSVAIPVYICLMAADLIAAFIGGFDFANVYRKVQK